MDFGNRPSCYYYLYDLATSFEVGVKSGTGTFLNGGNDQGSSNLIMLC